MTKTASKIILIVGQETCDQAKRRPWIVLDDMDTIRYMGATYTSSARMADRNIYAGNRRVVHANDVEFKVV